MPRGKVSVFATFGGHLLFERKMNKCVNISKTVRARVISS